MDGATVIESGLANYQRNSDWIVCGWFTEDAIYRPLAEQLAQSLDDIGASYDLASIPRRNGGWEANTMAKAGQVLAAMDRYPDKTIVFLDVDCRVIRDLTPLLNEITSDIAIRFRAKTRNNRTWMTPRSSAIVIRPSEAARRFVTKWREASQDAGYGTIDQSTFVTTLCRTPGVSFSPLDARWGAMNGEIEEPAIVHLGAGNDQKKIRGLRYAVGKLLFNPAIRR